uniref:F-box domain-containing protein n=1 Tax=Ditylenchus dipsaci TaxID=166011 RepID=A0A915EBP7_9BILA
MGSTNSTNQLPVEIMDEMFQFLEWRQSAKLLEVSRSFYCISRSPHYLRRAKLQKVRLFSSHQSSDDQESEGIFEDTYMELGRNGMYQQAGEFRGRALHLILEKRRLRDQTLAQFKEAKNHVLAEFKRAAINLSTEYEVMIENPQG